MLAFGCSEPAADDSLAIGLLLSYSGHASSSSINSERGLLLALEEVNRAGGIAGRRVSVMARDTQSDPRKVERGARELRDARLPVIIGPDNNDIAVELKPLFTDQVVIMPSFTTTEFTIYKPQHWFVMGAASGRVACELVTQVRQDGRKRPLVIADPIGYNSLLSWQLTSRYEIPQVFLPRNELSDERNVGPILASGADAFVLAALPHTASSLIYTLSALGALDPQRWYLSPTLHTPAFLDNLPRGLMNGARGVAAGTGEGAGDFHAHFTGRWREPPRDDAYRFYDATAVALLALERSARTGAIAPGIGLGEHIVEVTAAGREPVKWNELGKGLAVLRAGGEVSYAGLSGPIAFDVSGQSRVATTNWWSITEHGFEEGPPAYACPR